jgi:hypothetical protein
VYEILHFSLSRRLRLLAPVVAILLTIAVAAPNPADAAPVTAATADSFVESIGVDTHFSFDDTPYVERFQEVKAKLVELGVHHIREDLLPGRPDQYQRINELAAAGIGDTLIMGSPENGTAGLDELLSVVHNKLTGVDALEGPNEPYIGDQPGWTTSTDAYQQQLHEGAAATPSLASVPIVGPTTIFWQEGELGNISPWLSYGDIHPYSGGYPPEPYLERHVDFAALSSGTKPLMATETGFHNAMNWKGAFPATSEEAAAVYMPRIFLDYFQEGIARTFDYELVDEFDDPSGEEREAHFGLLRHDLSPKPAFIALKNLISIVGERNGGFTPGALDYSVSGNTEKLHQVLLQKADGSFYLALWRASSVWDPERQVPLSAPTIPVKLQFGQPIASAAEYMPNKSSEPLAQPQVSGGALQVNVGPEVVILKLSATPGATTESPASTEAPATGEAPTSSAPPTTTPPPTKTGPKSGGPSGSSGSTSGGSTGHSTGKHPHSARVKAWVAKAHGGRRSRVTVRGRVAGIAGRASVAIEAWSGSWRTIGRAKTTASGTFGTQVALRPSPGEDTAQVRVSSPAASPSAPIAVRVG